MPLKKNLKIGKIRSEPYGLPQKLEIKHIFFKVYNFSGIIIASFIKADTLMSLAKIRDFSADEQIVLTDDSGNFLAGVGNTSFPDINYPLDNKAKIKVCLENILWFLLMSIPDMPDFQQ